MRTRPTKKLGRAMALLAASAIWASGALAQSYVLETGIERLSSPQTLIEGLHRTYVGRQITPNLSFGQGFYSAALGDAGGAFFWGFEGVARLPLSGRLSLSAAGFIGGGGGAAQVVGDGTMLRAGISLDYRVTRAWDVQASASWIRIDGAPIDGPGFGIGLRHRIGDTRAPGTGLGDAGVVVSGFRAPAGVRNRSGGQQAAIALVGARALFDLTETTRLSLGAAGAAMGAQGYMQIMAGARRSFALGRATAFVEGGAGFGGGGLVDTGAGLLIEAGVGVAMPVTRRLDVELGFGGIFAPTGDFRAAAASLGVVRNFGRTRSNGSGAQRWAYSGGISVQQTGPGYFSTPNTASFVAMQESAIDFYVGRNLYVTGNGQTTLHGGVAGYAVGMIGLGYQITLSPRWALSVEGHLGAAGGGGVNTAGGLIGGLRAEIDYRIRDSWSLSLGLGHLTTLRANGMSSNVATFGVKIPFTTH